MKSPDACILSVILFPNLWSLALQLASAGVHNGEAAVIQLKRSPVQIKRPFQHGSSNTVPQQLRNVNPRTSRTDEQSADAGLSSKVQMLFYFLTEYIQLMHTYIYNMCVYIYKRVKSPSLRASQRKNTSHVSPFSFPLFSGANGC